MKRRLYLSNLVRTLALSLVPVLVLSTVFFLVLIPRQEKVVLTGMQNSLSLIQENVSLLLNDTTKVMNLIENQATANMVGEILRREQLGYLPYVYLKQVGAQLNAIANSRDYIDSIYIYMSNERGAYITNSANVLQMDMPQDPNWLEVCRSDERLRLVRRNAGEGSQRDYLTIVEQNSKGSVVAVNITPSYFGRMFDSLHLQEGQSILIADRESVLFSSSDWEVADLLSLLASHPDGEIIESEGYLILRAESDLLYPDCILITPKSTAYAGVYQLLWISAVTTALCALFCVLSSYRTARNSTRSVYSIFELMDAASQNKPLPPAHKTRDDIYGYIMTNLLETFVQNDYLKVSLNERRYQALSLELSALQYQINPHFLANTLQMIDFEVLRITRKPCAANQMIGQLSQFLQYSLRAPERDVSVEQEVQATRHYTGLMKSRYADKLTVEWRVAQGTLELAMPKLMLQPVIENAIQHGLGETGDAVAVTVDIALAEQCLRIVISDNGPGVPPERLHELRESLTQFEGFSEKHIGLKNLCRRLHLRYGEEGRVELDSAPGAGFSVTLTVPAQPLMPEVAMPSTK